MINIAKISRIKFKNNFKFFKFNIILIAIVQIISIFIEFIKFNLYFNKIEYNYHHSLELSKFQSDISYLFVFLIMLTCCYIYYNRQSHEFTKYLKEYIIYFIFHYILTIFSIELLHISYSALNGAEMLPFLIVILLIVMLIKRFYYISMTKKR